MAAEDLKRGAAGFEGEITGLGLSDIIQLHAANRFSGCIDVQYEQLRGRIFLKDGEVVHAEQGDRSGETAFYEIVSWPGGHFSHRENVATTLRTIRKSSHFLVLEAHRLVDERRAPPRAPPAPPARAAPKSTLLERLRTIPGVHYAVVQGKDGGRLGDQSYEAEVLAGQALYVAMVGRRFGEKLQAGEIHSAVVHGTTRHLVLFVATNHLVSVLVDGGAQVGMVEAAVRKSLAQGR